jgi:hypothetical protein
LLSTQYEPGEERERKVHAVQRKASGVEAWQRHAMRRRGSWRWTVGGLASATEIDDGVEEARRVHGGSSTEAATGEAGPSKRHRSTASSVNQAPARYVSPACCDLHLDLHVVVAVVGAVVGAVVAVVGLPAMALFVALHCLLAVLRSIVVVDVSLAVSVSSTHHLRGVDTVMGTHFIFGNGLKMLKIQFVSMDYIGSLAYLYSILCACRSL